MPTSPLVSVIVPAYRAEPVLPRCLDSIIGQTHRELEIILVNDGSPDRTGAVCDAYAARDSRIRVLHQKNAGVSNARNRGLELATGEFVQFADADDLLTAGMTASLLTAFADASVDLSLCGLRFVTVRGGSEVSAVPWEPLHSGNFDATDVLRFLYRVTNTQMSVLTVCHNKLFRRRVIASSRLRFEPGLANAEDSMFTLAYLAHCRNVALTDQLLYNYMHEIAPDRQSAVQRYHRTELDTWLRYGRRYQEIMDARIGGAELPRRNAACASLLIAALVRFCRGDATIGDAAIREELRQTLAQPDVKAWLADYRPGAGQSRTIPALMKAGLVDPLLIAARQRADKRYGEYYANRAANS